MTATEKTSNLKDGKRRAPGLAQYRRVLAILETDPALRKKLGPATTIERGGTSAQFPKAVLELTDAMYTDGLKINAKRRKYILWRATELLILKSSTAGIEKDKAVNLQAKDSISQKPSGGIQQDQPLPVPAAPAPPPPHREHQQPLAVMTEAAAKISTNSTNSTPPRPFEFEAAVFPPKSVLDDYAKYACERLESAVSYIIGAILPVLSACLARRVFFVWGDERVYPNLFSMLSGKAGERKSSAVDLAEKFAKAALGPESFLPPVCSSESLMDEYDKNVGGLPDKLLLLDDANALLSTWTESGYGARVGQQFLRLYDCKDLSEAFQKNKTTANVTGKRRVPETSTSVVLGATFDACRLQGRGISSGLQRRFLFYAAERHGRFIPCPPPCKNAEFERLAGMFRELCKLEAACRFSKRALAVWERYQQQNRDLLCRTGKDDVSARLNGAPRAVQKIAMLFEAACSVGQHQKWDGTIRVETLELAIEHIDHCLQTAAKLDALANREATAVSAESLLARIRRDFGSTQRDGWIVLTKSELTAKYAPHPDRPHAWTPADLYERLIPALIQNGLARLGGKEGKKVSYEFSCEDA
ncbi:MAG: DUF3987 domain-containing protein [Limisphaerales bacterium]